MSLVVIVREVFFCFRIDKKGGKEGENICGDIIRRLVYV